MLEYIRLAEAFIKHRWHCADRKGHGVHSPFFFEFITNVLPDTGHLPKFEVPERYRASLLKDPTPFERVDLGAGSKDTKRITTVRSMAGRSLQKPRWARLLHRMIDYYRPGPILELGTSFGVTTEYLASADPSQVVYTLEGDPFVAERSTKQFRLDGFSQIESVWGNFDDRLSGLLDRIGQIGFIWLDGNHRKDPTLRYFERLLPHVQDETLMVLDDIYWSASMRSAWEVIQQHPRVTASIDLFQMGVVLFRRAFHQKSHIRLPY